MTWRAVCIGVLCSLFIAGAGYVNDRLLDLESFNSGHQLPVIVLGTLFVVVAGLNPLLARWNRRLPLVPAELAIIVTLSMVACSIPGRGLMEQFTQVLVMPHHWSRVTPGWKDRQMLEYVPKPALVTVNEDTYDRVVSGYIMGAETRGRVPPPLLTRLREKWDRVPWSAWWLPLRTWVPMVLLLGVASACLALIVHQQWSHHEFLSYPIATFTSSLLERAPGSVYPAALRSRLFWIGFLIIFAIRSNNGLCVWFPDALVPVKLSWLLTPFAVVMPWLLKVQYGGELLRLDLFSLVVAFAFFLSAEISFTLGVSQLAWVLFALPMVTVGVNLSTDWIGGWQGWERAGAYLAFALILLYTGRQYYKEVLLGAVGLRRGAGPAPNLWAMRLLFAATLLLIVLIVRLGLEWPLAVILVLLTLLSLVVLSRISAETGLFFIQPRWIPFGVMMAGLGGFTMPPGAIITAGFVCMVLAVDQSQSLMPYLTNGLKICEKVALKPLHMARLSYAVFAVGVVLAIVVVLVCTYDMGAPTDYNWSHQRIPTMPFRAAEPEIMRLQGMGSLAEAAALPWTQRLGRIAPTGNFLWAFGAGFGLVLVCSALRLRLPWWPIHPVMFMLWATYPMATTCWSFFVGWLIKVFAVRFGGNRTALRLKPLMIGVISGEILAALVFMIVGAVYFFATGQKPLAYRYFPR
jgi:hypothetical protein